MKAVKLKNGWVMEDKNAAVPSKRKRKHESKYNNNDVKNAKLKESIKVKTKPREEKNEENKMVYFVPIKPMRIPPTLGPIILAI